MTEALAGLSLRQRGDGLPDRVPILGVVGPGPDASGPRPLELAGAELPATRTAIRGEEALRVLDSGQLSGKSASARGSAPVSGRRRVR